MPDLAQPALPDFNIGHCTSFPPHTEPTALPTPPDTPLLVRDQGSVRGRVSIQPVRAEQRQLLVPERAQRPHFHRRLAVAFGDIDESV